MTFEVSHADFCCATTIYLCDDVDDSSSSSAVLVLSVGNGLNFRRHSLPFDQNSSWFFFGSSFQKNSLWDLRGHYVCDRCIMDAPLIFCPVWMSLIINAEGTQHIKKNGTASFMGQNIFYKYAKTKAASESSWTNISNQTYELYHDKMCVLFSDSYINGKDSVW